VVVVPVAGLELAHAISAANYSLGTRLRCMNILEDAARELSGRTEPPLEEEEAPALPSVPAAPFAPAAPAVPTDAVAVSATGLEPLCEELGFFTRLSSRLSAPLPGRVCGGCAAGDEDTAVGAHCTGTPTAATRPGDMD
jgi:hypothetical protein